MGSYLFASELAPFLSLEALIKLLEVGSAEEVDESVTHIALVFDVAGQVQEIVGVGQLPIDLFGQLLDGVLVWDVSNHDGGPRVRSDVFWKDGEERSVVVCLVSIVVVVVGVVTGVVVVADGLDVDCASIAFGKRGVD